MTGSISANFEGLSQSQGKGRKQERRWGRIKNQYDNNWKLYTYSRYRIRTIRTEQAI